MRLTIIGLFLALGACEFERPGRQVLPQAFIGAQTNTIASDLVEVTVTVARPRPGAIAAYSDCVAAGYALIRGVKYARRVAAFPLATHRGKADMVSEKTTYLVTDLKPAFTSLTASDVIGGCRKAGVPTI